MILPGNEAKTLPSIAYEEMKGTIHIKGRSISPEVEAYYGDFLPYLEDNLKKNPMNLKIDIEFEYFNTKTAKLMMQFFGIVKKNVVEKDLDANITWIIEEGDDDLLEAAEDYEELTKLKFNYITKPEE